MENTLIAKTFSRQESNAAAVLPGAVVADDAAGQFGALLTKQLRHIMAQGGAAAQNNPAIQTDQNVDRAAMLVDISGQLSVLPRASALSFEDGEPAVSGMSGDVVTDEMGFLMQSRRLAVNTSGLAREPGKGHGVGDGGGKKLPPDLPEEPESNHDPLAEGAAAMVAVQFAAGAYQPAQQARATGGDVPVAIEGRADATKGIAVQEVPLRVELPADVTSDVSASLQATPQSFTAVMAERPAPSAGAVPVLEIPHRVGTGQWGDGLGDKVVWMVGSQTQGAELRLNPPALGPLEVRVSMSDGQASLSFMTPHAPVREAIEAATSRLREMLGESGISLGSVAVNVGTFAQQQPGSQDAPQQRLPADHWRAVSVGEADDALAVPAATSVQYLRDDGGMVDLFA